MKPLNVSVFFGIALAVLPLSALAGSSLQVLQPVRSKQELNALKPGCHVAHECPHCGAITVSKVGKDKSHSDTFSCPVCKMTVAYADTAGGKVKRAGLECRDVKTGKRMSGRVCAEH